MLIERIESDFKTAMKEKNEIKLRTLRMLKAAIRNKEIEKKLKSLPETEILEIIQKQIKQRKDSISDFEKGNRQDLAAKEKGEVSILEQYLPKQLTEAEIKALVEKAIKTTGATTKSDMGKVMKELMPQLTGKADGKLVSQIVSSCLNP